MEQYIKSNVEIMQQTIQFFEKLLRASIDGILITDAAHNILIVSDTFCAILGREWREVVETNVFNWLEQLDPQGATRWIELVNCVHQKGSCHDVEFRVVTQAHGVKYFSINASLLERVATEETGVIISIWRDITQLKNNEESLRQAKEYVENLVETAHVLVVGLDISGNIRVFNKTAEEITGYKKTEILGKNWFEVIVPKDKYPFAWEDFSQLQKNGLLSKTFENPIITKAGTKRYIAWQNNVIQEREKITGTISFGTDITEQKRTLALVEQMRLTTFVKDIGIALTRGTTLHEILRQCAEAVVNNLNAAFARIWTFNAEDNVLELQASAGMYTHMDGPHSRVPVGKFKIGLIAQNRKPHLTNAVLDDPHIGNRDWAKQEGMVSFAGYPLILEDRLVGVMAMFSRKQLSVDIPRALASVAEVIALGIVHKQDEEELKKSEKRFRTIFDNANDGILIIDTETKKFYTGNTKICHMIDYTPEEIKNLTVMDIHPKEDLPIVAEQYEKLLRRERTQAEDIPVKRKDGSIFYADINTSLITFAGKIYLMGIFRDVTGRKKAEERMRHMAFHDALTSLPNRLLFHDRLTLALAHAHRTQEMLAVLFLDLDRFKVINDTLGHTVGDQLLRGVADRLKTCVREDDTIARLGGDEFSLLLPGITHGEDVNNIAHKIIEAFKRPWRIEGHELYVTTSIGIVLYPHDGNNSETLLRNADSAMYHAKEEGRNNYQFYTADMHVKSYEKMILEISLRQAIERKEFVLHYQPQVQISTGQIVGMEALVRWQHPERGLIFPAEFLTLAEDTGLIVPMDKFVLHAACAQNRAWQDAGFPAGCVSVNLSAYTFQQANLLETITSVLQETGLDPRFLGLEITEGIAMQDIETTIYKLNKLSELGIQIAIDDFGVGFSSLSYLKKFPVNKLKISPQFINGIVTHHKDLIIVSSVISLAQGLQFKVIAEGVETKEQLSLLKQLECEEIQGYLFSLPLSADALGNMLWRDKFCIDTWQKKLSMLFPEKKAERSKILTLMKK